MTLDEFFAELGGIPDVVLYPGASDEAMAKLEQRYGIRLPTIHRELLRRSNGIEADGGYLRLYGVGSDAAVDMTAWNEPELWKFAWPPFVADLVSFGGTAWGHQFAYRLSDLSVEVPDAPVHMLAAIHERVRPSRQTFQQYLFEGFLTNAREPLSAFNRKVRQKLGDLAPTELLTLAPHPLLGGAERVGNVMRMPASTAMVIEGDIRREWRQASQATGGYTEATGVAPYVDDVGRTRMRLVYRPAAPEGR